MSLGSILTFMTFIRFIGKALGVGIRRGPFIQRSVSCWFWIIRRVFVMLRFFGG